MSELKHWLDEAGEADEFERSVLRAGLIADPPQAIQDEVWSSLVGTLALAPSLAVTTGTQASAKAAAGAAQASGVWVAVAKGFVVGLAVYGAAAAVSEMSTRLTTRPAPASSTSRPTSPARPSSSGSESLAATPFPVLAPATEDAKATPHATLPNTANATAHPPLSREPALPGSSIAAFADEERASRTQVSQLDAETRALRRARDELRSGKLADAFATLEASRRQFSAPELYQEREALMIELLHRSGQETTAMQRARAFLRQFPESPHAQKVRRFAGQ